MSNNLSIVDPNEISFMDKDSQPEPKSKATTECFPGTYFYISNTNRKLGLVSGSDFVKMGTKLYNGGVFVGRGAYNVACFFTSFIINS